MHEIHVRHRSSSRLLPSFYALQLLRGLQTLSWPRWRSRIALWTYALCAEPAGYAMVALLGDRMLIAFRVTQGCAAGGLCSAAALCRPGMRQRPPDPGSGMTGECLEATRS